MNAAINATRNYLHELASTWNQFWYSAADPVVLSAIRVFAGLMLFYTHLVWSLDLEAFFMPDGWLPLEFLRGTEDMPVTQPYQWSYFWLIESKAVLWIVHILALIVFALLTVGLWSRVMSWLAFPIAVAYANRVAEAGFFGLDKINCILAMYLMIGPCGAYFSLDRWFKRRRAKSQGQPFLPPAASVSANVAIRLLQLHMCIMYIFAGTGKLQGWAWWDGTAMWLSFANYEYQSIDMTWMAAYPGVMVLITHISVFWELFYAVLVWHKITRPIILFLAVMIHGGIALTMGMITFGLAMLIGNMAFLSPNFIHVGWRILSRQGKAMQT